MNSIKLVFLGSLLVLCSSCVGPVPVEEYTLARTAIIVAKEKSADRYAPGLWFKAEQSYKRAQRLLKERENDEAKVHFLRAKQFAERAETAARVKKFQTGDTFP